MRVYPQTQVVYNIYCYLFSVVNIPIVFFFNKQCKKLRNLHLILNILYQQLGSACLYNMIKRYNIQVSTNSSIYHEFQKDDWNLLVNEKNKKYITPEAINLIDSLLRWHYCLFCLFVCLYQFIYIKLINISRLI